MKQKNYILLGPPGSGKSTAAKLLCKEFALRHMEMGHALRRVASEDSPLGRMVADIIYVKKELVPDQVVRDVLSVMLDTYDGGVLLDGAPRSVGQIDDIFDTLEGHHHTIDRVIYLALPIEVAIERISRRMLCLTCETPYMLGKDQEAETGICSACQGKVGHRKDDTPEGVEKRYKVFTSQTLDVIEYFREKGLLLEVDASKTPEEVDKQIVAGLKSPEEE